MDSEPVTLKAGHARSVHLGPSSGGGREVVKRFRHPRLRYRWRDGRRAHTEHRWLVRLHALGLPVPRPLGVARDADGWAVRMEWLADAVSAEALLRGSRPWPAAPEVLAARLGAVLAALHAAGVEHPDLHPGNVLVDGAGRIWLVDFHKALRARDVDAAARRDLVRLAAATREDLSARTRVRALLAWARARGAGDVRALGAEVERRARAARRRHVHRRRRRWLRTSGATRRAPDGVERRGVEPALRTAAEALLREAVGPGPGEPGPDRAGPDLPGARLVLYEGPAREVRAAWQRAGELEEHGLPAARPVRLSAPAGPRGRAAAVLALPPGSFPSAGTPEVRARLARLLADRGLAAGPGDLEARPGPAPLWSTPLAGDAAWFLGPGAVWEEVSPGTAGPALERPAAVRWAPRAVEDGRSPGTP